MRDLSRALVLGGAGFLGSWVVERLLADGVAVTSLDREPAGRVPPGAASVVLDAASPAGQLEGLLADNTFDVVICLVGSGAVPRSFADPLADLEANVSLPLALLEALRPLVEPPTTVFASSAAVYGEAATIPISEGHALRPISPYGVSKAALESYVDLYRTLYALPVLTLRLFSLYGPRQRKLVVHDLLVRLLTGEDPLVVRAPASVTRDLLYVEDAAAMVVEIARSGPAQGEAFNICSGVETSLADLGAALATAAGTGVSVEFTGSLRPGDPTRWVGDGSAAAKLGAASSTSLQDGLAQTVAWLVSAKAD